MTPRRWRIIAGAAATIVVAGVVVSCTSGSSDSTSGGDPAALPTFAQGEAQSRVAGDSAGARDAVGEIVEGGGASAPEASAADQAAPEAVPPLSDLTVDNREVIRIASLSVELTVPQAELAAEATDEEQREADAQARRDAVDEAAASVRAIAASVNGFLAGAEGSGSSITVSVRVPAAQYDAVLERLAALGEVTSRSESAQDVTTEVVDINSRVETLTASVTRMRALLAEATAISDIISIEAELSAREANLESLKQQQAYLTGQVALSTITVSLSAVTDFPSTADPADEQSGFLAGLAAGWSALGDFFRWIGGAVGAVLPFLPFVAAAAALVWWLVRRARRRSRTADSGAAPAVDTTTAPPSPEAVAAEEKRETAPVG